MAQKIKDVVIKTGEYQDRQSGETKGRWQNVGALMRGDEGNEFIILERWFNPAGLPNPDNRGSVILSCFEIRERAQSGNDRAQGGQKPADDFEPDTEIPF